MAWRFQNALHSFPSFSQDWDRINQQRANHILLDSLFIDPLLRNFGSKKLLLAVCENAQAPRMTLIEPARPGFWQTFQPGQAPLGAIVLAGGGVGAAQSMEDLLRALPGFALGLSVTQQDPDFTCFGNLNGNPAVETLDYIQTPRLTICGKYEDYWKQRSKNLTHNLSRQRRRLKEQGGVLELSTDRNAKAVPDALREYGLLESTGWKGEEGSAVAADNVQGRFYREMLENFCHRGEAVIYRLRLNGTTVASDLCLERNGTLFILKTAYDENVPGLSLGLLLHQEIFQSVFEERKIRVIEFYGRLRDWHTKWTNEIRTMYHINFYRSAWVPRLRKMVKPTLSFGRGLVAHWQ
jgi:hypothetical protein